MTRRNERPRRIDQPEPGYFKVRMVRKGPWVAARIGQRFGFWFAEINGTGCGATDPDPAKADGVYRVWSTGAVITKTEFEALLRKPPASPDKPIDLGSIPPAF